MLEVRSWC